MVSMPAGMVARKPRRATVTEMCIQSMRFLEFSVLAMTPKRTKARPNPAGDESRGVGAAGIDEAEEGQDDEQDSEDDG